MKKLFTLVTLCVVANAVSAEVITLKCEGTNASGETYSETVIFSPDEGWSMLESLGATMTGSVSADYIDAFMSQLRIDRRTGTFTQGRGDAMFKGKCAKNDTKF